jgi:hypothetical protein
MYELRRTYKTQPGKERIVASLLQRMGDVLVEAGQRSPSLISFNGGTCPGEKELVHMTWTSEKIESPMRAGNANPPLYGELRAERNKHTVDTWLEINELMNDDKLID